VGRTHRMARRRLWLLDVVHDSGPPSAWPCRSGSAAGSVESCVPAANGPLIDRGRGFLPAFRRDRNDAGERRPDDAAHCLGIIAFAPRLGHLDMGGSPSVSSAVWRLVAKDSTSPKVPECPTFPAIWGTLPRI
jgi:hypothetical protein